MKTAAGRTSRATARRRRRSIGEEAEEGRLRRLFLFRRRRGRTRRRERRIVDLDERLALQLLDVLGVLFVVDVVGDRAVARGLPVLYLEEVDRGREQHGGRQLLRRIAEDRGVEAGHELPLAD